MSCTFWLRRKKKVAEQRLNEKQEKQIVTEAETANETAKEDSEAETNEKPAKKGGKAK